MEQLNLEFEHSAWWISVILAGALGYAYLLYSKKPLWNTATNRFLAGLRFLLVFIIGLLLLNPFIHYLKSLIEKPTVVFAVDHSSSARLTQDSASLAKLMNVLKSEARQLEDNGVQTRFMGYKGKRPADSLQFAYPSSNISGLMNQVTSSFENRNLGGAVLVSDGIYNQGISPAYKPYIYPVHTLGLGDTVPRTDINIRNLAYNKVAYSGNKFPLVAHLTHQGFEGEEIPVQVVKDGKVLKTQTVKLGADGAEVDAEFLLEAQGKGMQQYLVRTPVKDSEFSQANNQRTAYIDIIEGKKKVLLMADAPHPDIKALRSAIESQNNYDFTLHIPGLTEFEPDKYDLAIFHQIPSSHNLGRQQMQKLLDKGTSAWFILGSASNVPAFNQANQLLRIGAKGRQMDQVTAAFSEDFDLFKYPEDHKAFLEKMPPLAVPFGDYHHQEVGQVLAQQKVGTVTSDKPLFLMGSAQNRKQAVLAGTGIWRWRLQEYAETEDHVAFEDLVRKTVQYLSTKEDKRRFRVYPIRREFAESEKVAFEAEVYNDIYELVYNQKVSLNIRSKDGETYSYSFVNTEAGNRFELGTLPPGVYSYTARTTYQDKNLKSTGVFTVKALQLETMQSTAQHNLLRRISNENKGEFFLPEQAGQLAEELLKDKPSDIVRSHEEEQSIIHLKWLFFVLLGLASVEWFVRKYRGSY